MKSIKLFLFFVFLFPAYHALGMNNPPYSITTLFKGRVGESDITMSLTFNGDNISGKYQYDKYKKEILVNGNKGISNGIVLHEKLKVGSAVMTLMASSDGYLGEWCNKKCIPLSIKSKEVFRNGQLLNVNLQDMDGGDYIIGILNESNKQEIMVSDTIDTPSLEFQDLNGDGFYDLVITTDIRPNNGGQIVYVSTENGFVKEDSLSNTNGTLVFNAFNRFIVFHTKDDCCNRFGKVVYKYNGSTLELIDDLSFDYSSKKGSSSHGSYISKDVFESY